MVKLQDLVPIHSLKEQSREKEYIGTLLDRKHMELVRDESTIGQRVADRVNRESSVDVRNATGFIVDISNNDIEDAEEIWVTFGRLNKDTTEAIRVI